MAEPQHIRMVEALLFAAVEPLDEATLVARLPEGTDVPGALSALHEHYAGRGVHLLQVAGRWTFRTAPDLSGLLQEQRDVTRRLSRAAIETLAIIAYNQPVTRADIEEIRGVAISKGTLDVLMEAGWARIRGRRRTPGRPVTYGITDEFLIHFGLNALDDLPGLQELRAAGLLDTQPRPGMFAPSEAEEDPIDSDDGEEDDGNADMAGAADPEATDDDGREPETDDRLADDSEDDSGDDSGDGTPMVRLIPVGENRGVGK